MQGIINDFPQFEFVAGSIFVWSPQYQAIMYDRKRIRSNEGRLALLHEISHAVLGHRIYKYDIELIAMEVDAWEKTRELAQKYQVTVDEEHIAECIASYDHWITKRSTCPDCDSFCLQQARDQYRCFACGAVWEVNWRKDRRVTRRVVDREIHRAALPLQFAERK
ncbi:hypothetical protein EPO04_02120 [Patescibacteria group bacterium]|nr:MAG: hypothetical protein EPO04_02120 [Patescibacteria group bacterium]